MISKRDKPWTWSYKKLAVQCYKDMTLTTSVMLILIIYILLIGLFNTTGKFLPNPDEKESSPHLPANFLNPHRKLSSTVNKVGQQEMATKIDTLSIVTKSSVQSATIDNLPKSEKGASIKDLVAKADTAKQTTVKKSYAKKGAVKPKTFDWVKTRNMSHFILPEESTVILEPESCPPNIATQILGLVMTAPQNWKDREVVRSTWAKQLHNNINTKVVFIMGKYTTDTSIPFHKPARDENNRIISEEDMMIKLREEHNQFGDLIIEDFLDTYLNLTLKTSFGLKWITNNCLNTQFVLKIDDNVFLHPDNFLKYLETVKMDKKTFLVQDENGKLGNKTIDYTMFGNRWGNAPSNRNTKSKYYLPSEFYKEKKLPPFLRGMAYAFSGSLLEPLLECIIQSKYLPGEDVFVSGICATKKLKLNLTHHGGFWRGPVKVGGTKTCHLNNAVAVHDFEAEVMKGIYETLQDGETCVQKREVKLDSTTKIHN